MSDSFIDRLSITRAALLGDQRACPVGQRRLSPGSASPRPPTAIPWASRRPRTSACCASASTCRPTSCHHGRQRPRAPGLPRRHLAHRRPQRPLTIDRFVFDPATKAASWRSTPAAACCAWSAAHQQEPAHRHHHAAQHDRHPRRHHHPHGEPNRDDRQLRVRQQHDGERRRPDADGDPGGLAGRHRGRRRARHAGLAEAGRPGSGAEPARGRRRPMPTTRPTSRRSAPASRVRIPASRPMPAPTVRPTCPATPWSTPISNAGDRIQQATRPGRLGDRAAPAIAEHSRRAAAHGRTSGPSIPPPLPPPPSPSGTPRTSQTLTGFASGLVFGQAGVIIRRPRTCWASRVRSRSRPTRPPVRPRERIVLHDLAGSQRLRRHPAAWRHGRPGRRKQRVRR